VKTNHSLNQQKNYKDPHEPLQISRNITRKTKKKKTKPHNITGKKNRKLPHTPHRTDQNDDKSCRGTNPPTNADGNQPKINKQEQIVTSIYKGTKRGSVRTGQESVKQTS